MERIFIWISARLARSNRSCWTRDAGVRDERMRDAGARYAGLRDEGCWQFHVSGDYCPADDPK